MSDTERASNFLETAHVPEVRAEGGHAEYRETPSQGSPAAPIERAPVPAPPEVHHEAVPVAHAAPQDPLVAAIETAMAKGRVMEIYADLPPHEQEKFRVAGEGVAAQLRGALGTSKFHHRKSWRMIREWLHTLPGKDRSFLEQETNIVYNRVAKMHEEQRGSLVAM